MSASEQICVSPHAPVVKDLRARLVQIRNAVGITQEELGKRMNPDNPLLKQEVFRIEKGDALLTFERILMLSKAYGISPPDLVDLDKDIDDVLRRRRKPTKVAPVETLQQE